MPSRVERILGVLLSGVLAAGVSSTCALAASSVFRSPLAAPSNEECAGAIPIPAGPYPLTTAPVDIAEAEQIDEAGMCGPTDGTIWYAFTPSVGGVYNFSTCPANGAVGNTLADPVVAVFESTGGACPAGAQLACNDTEPPACRTAGFDGATIQVSLTAGVLYFVVVGKWSPQGPVVPPDSTIVIAVDFLPIPANDTCASPGALRLNRVARGTTAGASDDYRSPSDASCYRGIGQTPSSGPGRDVVYRFTAPAAGSYNVRWVQDEPSPALRGQNPVLYASSDCPAAGEVRCLLGANRETPESGQNKAEEIHGLSLAENETVYVFFDDDSAGNGGGAFDLEVTRCVTESEPNDDTASADAYSACFTSGSADSAADVDMFSVGNPPAGSKLFAAIDASQTNDSDWEMRITTSTDTLQYDNNDGTSIIGRDAPIIAGAPTDGSETFIRLNRVGPLAAEPYHLYARVESGAPQDESEPNNPRGNSLDRSSANPITGGGYLRGTHAASSDLDCFRFVANEGDDIVMFAGANPDRAAGAIVDTWPRVFDLAPSGYNLLVPGGQIARNLLGESPGTLTGTSPSITSEFWAHRSRYTGTQVVCFTPIQATGGFPLPWHGSISIDCGPIPSPASAVADVSITVSGPAGPVPTGSIVGYTVTVTNRGTGIAQDVRVTSGLPPEVILLDVFVSDGFGGANVACTSVDPVDCTNFSIAPGESTTWTFVVLVSGCIGDLEISNTATIASTASTDPDPTNNSSTWSFTATDDDSCSDFDECTAGDHCDSGACVSTGPVDCDDRSFCTDDFCDAAVGCVHDPTPGTQCNDGLECTLDLCDARFGLPENGHCWFPPAPAGTVCDDFMSCTGPDACDSEGNCTGAPLDCDDGNPCTDDRCDPSSACMHADNSAACDDGDDCTTDDTCTAGICIGPTPSSGEPNPRTNGYYKRLCHGPHSGDELTAADARCVATTASATFGWVQSVADICSVIEPAQPNNDMCQQSEDDLMVLALNLCKARVCPKQGIDSQCGPNDEVSESLAEMDALFSDPGRGFDTCQHGKCLGEEINTGRAIDMNSLAMTRAAGGVTLSWNRALQGDGPGLRQYDVWRRAIGNGAFEKIATVNDLTFTDPTVGNFEYEVTAKH